MKTFETIGISDVIYQVNKKGYILDKTIEKHGYYAGANLQKSNEVFSIEKNDERKMLDFNKKYNSYHGESSYLVRVPYDKINQSSHETDDHIFYLEETDFKSHVRRIVIDNINKTEQEIIDMTAQKNEWIRSLRENYWDFLQKNP